MSHRNEIGKHKSGLWTTIGLEEVDTNGHGQDGTGQRIVWCLSLGKGERNRGIFSFNLSIDQWIDKFPVKMRSIN